MGKILEIKLKPNIKPKTVKKTTYVKKLSLNESEQLKKLEIKYKEKSLEPKESKPQESKPQESKPQESKPQESKQQEFNPQESKQQEFNPPKQETKYMSNDIVIESFDEIPEYDYILHISDIHIEKNTKRHEEYREVFQNLYNQIDDLLSKGTKLVIAVLGDVVHEKIDLSSDNVVLGKNFLKNLSKRAPTVVIAGNHDLLENNQTKSDSISALVDDSMTNLYYFKYSGLYEIGSIVFCVSSLLDKKFLTHNSIKHLIPNGKKCVALYHGMIDGMVINNSGFKAVVEEKMPTEKKEGQEETSKYVGTTRHRRQEEFDGFDAVLLGDIHKRGYPNEKNKKMAYCSSLLQVSRGEDLTDHGFLLWDVKDLSHKFHRVKNSYGRVDLVIKQGKIETDISEFPNNLYIRYRYDRHIDNNKVFEEFKKGYNVIETRKYPIHGISHIDGNGADSALSNNDNDKDNILSNNDNNNNKDIDKNGKKSLESAVREMLTMQKKENPIVLCQKIMELYKEYKEELNMVDSKINKTEWIPKTVSFKNLQSYGNNIEYKINLDFGVTTINGKNKHGKSSILNIILFVLFGTAVNVGRYMVNNKQQEGEGEITFEYNGEMYELRRLLKRKKTGECEAGNINFNKILKNGERESLNRNKTSEYIKNEFLGNINKFLMCNVISTKYPTDNLINKKPYERKKVLAELFKVEDFTACHNLNNKKLSAIKEEFVVLQTKYDYLFSNIEEITNHLKSYENYDINYLEKELGEIQKNLTKLKERIRGKEEQIKMLDEREKKLYGEINPMGDKYEEEELRLELDKIQEQLTILSNDKDLQWYIAGETYDEIKEREQDEYVEKKLNREEYNNIMQKLNKNGIKEKDVKSQLETIRKEKRKKLEESSEESLEESEEEYDAEGLMQLVEEIDELKSQLVNIKETKEGITKEINKYEEKMAKSKTPSMDYATCQEKYKKIEKEIYLIDNEISKKTLKLKGDKNSKKPELKYNGKKTIDELKSELTSLRLNEIKKFKKVSQSDLDKIEKRLDKLDEGTLDIDKEISVIQDQLRTIEKDESHGIYQVPIELMDNLMILMDNIRKSGYNKTVLEEYRELEKKKQQMLNDLQYNEEIMKMRKENDKINNDRLKIESYINYLENNEINESLETLKREKSELDETMKVLKNAMDYYTYMDLLKQKREILTNVNDNERINMKINERQKRINQYYLIRLYELDGEYNRTMHQIKYLGKRLQLISLEEKQLNINEILSTIAKNKETMIKIKKLSKEKNTQMQELDRNRKEHEKLLLYMNEKENTLGIIKKYLKLKKEKEVELEKIKSGYEEKRNKIELYELFKELFNSNGIPLKLIEDNLPILEKIVNELIERYTKYRIRIQLVVGTKKVKGEEKETNNIEISIVERGTNTQISIESLSGYETILFHIAVKSALNTWSENNKCNMLCIDESLDCIDKENFHETLPKILDFIKESYESVLMISQRDISHISDNVINVYYDEEIGSSRIRVS